MAIHRRPSLASIITDHSIGCAAHRSNLSVHGDHAEAAEHLDSIDRLPARSSADKQRSHDLCRVRHLLSLSPPLASDESSCVIASMCAPKGEFQLLNPTTQLALFSRCNDDDDICSTPRNITWNIYHGSFNATSNVTSWTPFNNTQLFENIWFFGNMTSTDGC